MTFTFLCDRLPLDADYIASIRCCLLVNILKKLISFAFSIVFFATPAFAGDEVKSNAILGFEKQAKRICVEYPQYDTFAVRPFSKAIGNVAFTRIKCKRIRGPRNTQTFLLDSKFNFRLSASVNSVAEESPGEKINGASDDGLVRYSINTEQ